MLKKRIKNLGGTFDFDNWSQKLENLKQKSTNPEFWNDNQNAQSVLRKISRIEKNMVPKTYGTSYFRHKEYRLG